jgi:polyisoprenoid-binding protein YceI
MKKTSLIVLIAVLIFLPLSAQKKYSADPSATQITWTGKKLGKEHFGTINLKEGVIHIDNNAIIGGEFHVDMTTIKNTDVEDEKMNGMLVGHLKSDDFFGVENYPAAKLVLTGGGKFVNGTASVKGAMTIKGKTNPVEFTVKEASMGSVKTYKAVISVDRSLFDVRYGSGKFFSDLGDKAISDEFTVEVTLVAKS